MTDIFDPTPITESPEDAARCWKQSVELIKDAGLGSLLENPLLLELGCGHGVQLRHFIMQGIRAIGVDKYLAPEVSDLPVTQADIRNLPFDPASFDIVYSRAIYDPRLYHAPFSELLISIDRIMKPGGVYIGIEGELNTAEIGDIQKLTNGSSLKVLYAKFGYLLLQKSVSI